MRLGPALPAAASAIFLALPGCVAAIPLAAGGAILQSRMKDDRPVQAAAPAAEAPNAASRAILYSSAMAPQEDFSMIAPLDRARIEDFAEYASGRAKQFKAGREVQSALLLEPSSLKPDRRTCKGSLPAVLVDLDPAEANAPLEGPLAPSPLLARRLADLRANGVAVFWITRHGPSNAPLVRAALDRSGLDTGGQDGLVLMRFPGESKQERRMDLGDTLCLLAIAGAERSDFDELYQYLRQSNAATGLDPMFGHGWFVIPTPLSAAPAPPEGDPTDSLPKDDSNALDP